MNKPEPPPAAPVLGEDPTIPPPKDESPHPKSRTRQFREETELAFGDYGIAATVNPLRGSNKEFDLNLSGLNKEQIACVLEAIRQSPRA
jgi:hypothetical protein